MKKNLLITGGNGFLGINLAIQLKNKYNIFLASRNQKRNYEATQKTLCESIPLDVSNISSVRDAFAYANRGYSKDSLKDYEGAIEDFNKANSSAC